MNSAPNIVQGSDGDLAELIGTALGSIAENLGSLIDKPVVLEAGDPEFLNGEIFASERKGRFILLSGDLEKDYEGSIHVLCGLTEAITFASYMMMVPDEVVTKNREEETFTEEQQETFGEVGNIVFSALDEALRGKAPGKVNIRIKDQETCEFPGKAPESFSDKACVLYAFTCQIADFPKADGAILIPLEAAEKINGKPIDFGEIEGPLGAERLQLLEQNPEEDIEDIDQAPLQGRLATYVQDGSVFKKVRKSCRRVGLELEKRPKTEVPNPSAHREKIVFIEIARGDIKRFDWCRRLKESGEIQVAIMLMEPTEHAVAMAFKAGADMIVGWPIHERRLSAKLAALLQEDGAETPAREAASV